MVSETWAGGHKVGADPGRLVISGGCKPPGRVPMIRSRARTGVGEGQSVWRLERHSRQ